MFSGLTSRDHPGGTDMDSDVAFFISVGVFAPGWALVVLIYLAKVIPVVRRKGGG